MRETKCPEEYNGSEKSLFIAGGITNCPNWQNELIKMLDKQDITILNPRRAFYNENEEGIEQNQIKWEFEHLEKSNAVVFWFPKETLCPITLYELGKMSMVNKPLFIGVHPEYKRKNDIIIQTGLIRPEVSIVYSLKSLAEQIENWSNLNSI